MRQDTTTRKGGWPMGDECQNGHPWADWARYLKNGSRYCQACKTERRRTLRLEAIAAYGGACVCCGETEEAFLQFDHVNDDGKQHRADMGGVKEQYAWMKKMEYPDSIQLLCANCHMAKTTRGLCPHTVAATL